ncbi:MAG TPA: DNA polymerase III subunit gamma/tau [Oscillospiraceae bacterium]|mgnify:FL=1|uniref:DNA polymerase III subunit gamma/tau n=1 Tax=Ruminococcus bromii TaxID=40518 RepID=UPI00241CFEBD|nr:DNA polymerase III subunit gamma/tau [Ruminococcus bromii]HJI85164.1 DNA polymerase III subunit gamma/tau [Oscillospiraceae bacterium]
MYQVLYRKWRPKTFSDVSGQEHITTTLLNELSTNRLNHAYLFTGSRGTGKTTCAKILAKAVNCLHPVNGNPCGECEICKGIDSGSMLDVTEMDAASNRKIDDIRQIIDEVQFKPSKCKYRVYIIDEVHMLTTEAFNALLKTLEEPPEHAIFILATTEVHKLPQTILSRCQRFDFHRIPPRAIADRLLYVASQEGVTLSDGAALLAASVADGALRDALSLLDRCIAISSDIDEDVVRSAAGLARKTYLFELANCVINKNTAKALEIVNRLYGESKDMARLCDELLSHFRTLMLIKSVKNPRDIIIMADDEFEQAQVQSDYLSLADIVYYMDVLSRAYQNMGRGTGDRTELEMAVVKLSSAELDGTVEALTARVTALEKAVKKGIRVNCVPEQVQAVSQPVQSETPKPEVQKSEPEKVQEVKPVVETEKDEPVAPTPKIQGQPAQEQPVLTASAPKKAVQRQSVDLDAIYNNAQPFPDWAEVVNNMKPVSRTIAAAFANSSAYTSGKYMLIDTDNEMAFELLKNNERRQEIRQLIFETTGQHYNLGPYKRPSAKQEDKTDPVDRLVESLQGSDVIITQK